MKWVKAYMKVIRHSMKSETFHILNRLLRISSPTQQSKAFIQEELCRFFINKLAIIDEAIKRQSGSLKNYNNHIDFLADIFNVDCRYMQRVLGLMCIKYGKGKENEPKELAEQNQCCNDKTILASLKEPKEEYPDFKPLTPEELREKLNLN